MSEILEKDVFKKPLSIMPPASACGLNQNQSVKEALDLMVSKKMGSILISNDEDKFVGILTERDFLVRLNFDNNSLEEIRLNEVMTKSPSFLTFNAPIEDALGMMVKREFRHVPITTDENKNDLKFPMNIISARDILKFIVDHFPQSVASFGTTTADKIYVENTHNESFNKELLDSEGKFISGNIFSLPLSKIITRRPVMVSPDESIEVVHSKLIKEGAEAAIVVEYATTVLGIVTERDFLSKIIARKLWGKEIAIKNLMTTHPHALMPKHKLAYAINNMFSFGYRHVILVDEEKCPIGLISVLEILGFIYRRIFSMTSGS